MTLFRCLVLPVESQRICIERLALQWSFSLDNLPMSAMIMGCCLTVEERCRFLKAQNRWGMLYKVQGHCDACVCT